MVFLSPWFKKLLPNQVRIKRQNALLKKTGYKTDLQILSVHLLTK